MKTYKNNQIDCVIAFLNAIMTRGCQMSDLLQGCQQAWLSDVRAFPYTDVICFNFVPTNFKTQNCYAGGGVGRVIGLNNHSLTGVSYSAPKKPALACTCKKLALASSLCE